MHYPSQTAAPSRGFPDFLLRAPAASVDQPESGSTTEVSESDEEEGEEEVEVENNAAEGPATAADLVPPASPHRSASNQHAPPQDAGPSRECEHSVHAVCSLRL